MYCNFCNSQLPDGVYVCAVCGHNNAPTTPNDSEPYAASEPYAPEVAETPVEKTEYEYEAPAAAPAPKAKKDTDPLSNGISALVWGCLSALMSFGGLFFAMNFECAIFGIVMAIVSKSKAKAAKAYKGTVGAALAKGAGAVSTFGLIASIYTLVMLVVTIALLVFFYLFYLLIMFIALYAGSGMYYYY